MRQPCNFCPFRVGSGMAYDEDAMEALDNDFDAPCCHAVVGPDSIFATEATSKNRCVGYDKWAAGESGYQRPNLLPKEGTQQ